MIAYPTEAVFGLGCLPWDRRAVERILALKRRRPDKGLIIVAGELEQVIPLISLEGEGRETVLSTWPGPVTWVLPPGRIRLRWISGRNPGIAVRVSAHPVIRALCADVGPIISTSANPEGRVPARSPRRVRAYFGDALDYILPAPLGGGAAPTEIRDFRTGRRLR